MPEDEFSTPVLLEGTYPPAIFINMQRDSSEQQQQRLVGWLDGSCGCGGLGMGLAAKPACWFHGSAAEQMPQPIYRC